MSEITDKAQKARAASLILANTTSTHKNEALLKIADELLIQAGRIIEANTVDIEQAKTLGTSAALQDRLLLNRERMDSMAESIRLLVSLPDPVGEILAKWETATALKIEKQRVPLGVVAIIYEARPNVTVDAATLCIKTGNAVLLRGSSTAINSNLALVAVIQDALEKTGLPPQAVQLIEDTNRESVQELLSLTSWVDVVIPRGGAALIRHVVENATVPVLETGAGNCHVYIDSSAEPGQAIEITVNAKTQRPSVCNAAETVLVHQAWANAHLADLIKALRDKGVECRGCENARKLVPDMKAANEEDWATEFLDYIIAVRVVEGVDQAVSHINTYGTRHSEAIISRDENSVAKFFQQVDAAALYHNASTRFTDGFEFGFGAEIGISTQKLHARGPMGLPELTTYKYLVSGTGQIRK